MVTAEGLHASRRGGSAEIEEEILKRWDPELSALFEAYLISQISKDMTQVLF